MHTIEVAFVLMLAYEIGVCFFATGERLQGRGLAAFFALCLGDGLLRNC